MARAPVVDFLFVSLMVILLCCTPSAVTTAEERAAEEKPSEPATYWVTFSTRVRPGMRLPVTVHLTRPGHTATVTISLVDHSDHSAIFSQAPSGAVWSEGNSRTVNLDIPRNLKNRPGLQYVVRVVATGDVHFNRSQTVTLDEKAFSIFVQTDKGIYKPGQTVKIRALAMYPDLTVVKAPMDILIRDSMGNAIKRWRQSQGYGDTGVVERTMPTSTDPPLGEWEVRVTLQGSSETKKFTVDKYVLPKFEATLVMSDIYVVSDPGIRGKVRATYTFGKPLAGAKVHLKAKYPGQSERRYYYHPRPTDLSRTGMLNKNGELDFFFSNAELLELAQHGHYFGIERLHWAHGIKITAEVTDLRNGQKMKAESYVRYVKEAAKLEFLPLTPKTYKPGFPYTAYVKVTKADGTLFPVQQKVQVSFRVTMSVPDPSPPEERYFYPGPFMKDEHLYSENKPLPDNGLLTFDVNVPSHAIKISIQAHTKGVWTSLAIKRVASKSGHYLQITSLKKTAQVYTKNIMVSDSEAITSDAEGQKFLVSFPVTANMAPTCKVLVFYLRPDGEVLADVLSVNVDASAVEQVSVSYSRQKVQPGENVQMTLTARPNAAVFVLVVDKSVRLLKPGNDIDQDTVSDALAAYDLGDNYHGYWRFMVACGWSYPSHAVNADRIFKDARVAMLTDGFLYSRSSSGPHYRYRYRMVAEESAPEDRHMMRQPSASDMMVENVRTFFPETWLWDIVLAGPSGQTSRKVRVPDTITTWVTSTFAVHPQFGLSVMRQPVQVTTFKEVFLSLDLPYSAIRGEDLCMKAQVFNYYSKCLEMTVTMDATPGIDNIRVLESGLQRRSQRVVRFLGEVGVDEVDEALFCFTPRAVGQFPLRVHLTTDTPLKDAVERQLLVEVGVDEVDEALFCFTPRAVGQFPLRVHLTTDTPLKDAVERQLLVESEGTPRVTNIPVILDLEPGETFEQEVPILFPDGTVEDSERITVSVTGNLLGPVLENIDDLLRMPYGCGEQNMLYFAPNVFLIDYMQKTSTYTPQRAEKAEKYMVVGYQKEIRYQHADGSFSAFGNRHKKEPGSMWLTAFVVKCFAQSMALEGDVLTMEPRILRTAITWITSRQRPDGSFPEPGTVIHKRMQGGSAKGVALSAYVLIALAEAQKHFKDLDKNDTITLEKSLSRGRDFLDQRFESVDDTYDLAIVTYALHVTQSTILDLAFNRLVSKRVQDAWTMHWERSKPKVESRYSWQRQTEALSIEMTSYALLTYLARGDVAGALWIVRWLVQQRGAQGGFISTQDTVIALQGLAQAATVSYQPSAPAIAVHVIWKVEQTEHSASVTLNDSTRDLVHTVHVPIKDGAIPSNITIRASSPEGNNDSGFALAEVRLNYNIQTETVFSTFSLSPEVEHVDDQLFLLHMSVKRNDDEQISGMTVIDVTLLTGYDVDESHNRYNKGSAKTAEQKGRHYYLYFDKLGTKNVMVTLPMAATKGLLLTPEPGVIHIYDYYDNAGDQQLEVKYQLSERSLCNEHPTYESCDALVLPLTG